MERPTEKTYARRPHQYGSQQLDRGQCMKVLGLKNDEKLQRLGYIAEFPSDTVLKQCGECEEWFIDEGSRAGHFQTRHDARELTAEEEDQQIDRTESFLEQVAPVHFDQTTASRKAGEAVELVTRAETAESELAKAKRENAELQRKLAASEGKSKKAKKSAGTKKAAGSKSARGGAQAQA